jgi:hypothetical protein
VVADWTLQWRERWGQRANELEETGLSWRDAETQAFVELWHQLQREGQAAPASSVDTTPTVVELTPAAIDPGSPASQ